MTRIYLTFFFTLMALCSTTAMAEDGCQKGYQTVFHILDCDHKPVESVDVTITLCCKDREKKGLTNEKGEVAFPFYYKDICARAIFGQASKGGFDAHCIKDPAKSDKTICHLSILVCGE